MPAPLRKKKINKKFVKKQTEEKVLIQKLLKEAKANLKK